MQNSDIKIATWEDFGIGGFRLRKQSMVAKWRYHKLARNLILLGGAWLFAYLSMPIFSELLFAPLTILALGGMAIAEERSKNRLIRNAFRLEDSDDIVVRARFEVDGFEYGTDFGYLSLEVDWLYFEGERTFFSMGRGDFMTDWHQPKTHRNKGLELEILHTSGHVGVRLESLSLTDEELRNRLWEWRRKSTERHGVSVLPPLEMCGTGTLHRSKTIFLPLLYGATVSLLATTLVLATMNASSPLFPLVVVAAFLVSIYLLCELKAGAFGRYDHNRSRRKAIQQLQKVRSEVVALNLENL